MDNKTLAFAKGFICLNKVVDSVSEKIRLNFDLNKKELCVLINIHQNKNISVKDLSRNTNTSISLISKTLKSLKKKNIIDTMNLSYDKRIQLVVITNYGYELLDQVVNYINSIVPSSVLEVLSQEGQDLLNLSDTIRYELNLNKK
uniref:MarR family transcriptional regulator n=1 Tax=Ignavibacterium album TaxID=591197 RepID=A0A832D0X1_9BACT